RPSSQRHRLRVWCVRWSSARSSSSRNCLNTKRMGRDMRICVAQTRPIQGLIQRNIQNHKRLVDLALCHRADIVVFPELSLTGYEPTLSRTLAMDQDDTRFDDFQSISTAGKVTIGVGVPTRTTRGICISMVVVRPDKRARRTYSKKFLLRDE